MESNVLIKIVNSKGSIVEVGPTRDWRFQKGSGLSGFSDFSADLTTSENSSRDGGSIDHRRLPSKDRTLKIINVYPSENPVERKRFKSFFKYGEKYKVIASYMDSTRWSEGELYRCQLSENTQTDMPMRAILTFKFANPYWLSMDDFGKNIAQVSPGAGFPWISPISVGTAIGVFDFSHEVVLNNDGDSPAYPRIVVRASGVVTNPVVKINDGFVRYIETIRESDELDINFEANPPTVRLNGQNVLGRCDRRSNFDDMILNVGENTISFDADDGSDELSVSVYFNKMYTMI